MNPKKGHVYPQLECIFDDRFTIVSHINNGTVPSNWTDLIDNISEEILPEWFTVRNTWLNQDQPPTHISNALRYLDYQTLDKTIPYESTGEHSGRSKVETTQESLVQEIPAFEGHYLDVEKPEPYHEGDGATFPSMVPTNEPSEIPEQRIRFVDDISLSTPHEPNLTIPEIVSLE